MSYFSLQESIPQGGVVAIFALSFSNYFKLPDKVHCVYCMSPVQGVCWGVFVIVKTWQAFWLDYSIDVNIVDNAVFIM